MADTKQVYRVELVVREDEGDQKLDEIDVERLIAGEIDWSDRLRYVKAEKLEEAEAGEVPEYIGPTP